MSEWKEYKLGDLVTFQRGHDLPRDDMKDGVYPVAGSNSIIGYHNKYTSDFPGITIGRSGNIGNPQLHKTKFWAHNTTLFVKEFKNVDPIFFYYLLKTLDFSQLNSGSAVPSLNRNFIHPFKVEIPSSIPTQTAIAEILSSLDDKIELNNKINYELETLAQTLFKQWFIDFEFPNENGEPYKSSGGEMVESELGEIPKGWEVNRLNDIADCFDNKRIPLSSMERNVRKGNYPYYGAASLMDYIDDYLFDGVYILMGEDGSVTDNTGYPVLQYVFGKFWVNNHAHVLKGRKISTELVLCLLKNTNISDLVTGAVQPKLNQGNMNKISIPLPKDLLIISDLEKLITEYYNLIRNNILEIKELVNIRDILLPKLISGELEINEINN
ncbi:restriction endonuclease subunit S [Daejeonella sp.]|uniref:restriction endonuclease subunit S n=1 Tax=Daejeonella sp. TaxID=2805397 RepID=UPI0025BD95B6|nr:restriction endonuclease subunit S [Daejeonella sp.]